MPLFRGLSSCALSPLLCARLEPEEDQILEKKENSEDIHNKMKELGRRIEENGYCANESELEELEEYEEDQKEDNP